MVPKLLPIVPDVICSQLLPEVTDAAQNIIVPVTVLETLNVVLPVSFGTSRVAGLTKRIAVGACVTVTSTGLPVAPLVAVIRMVAVRLEVVVLAE